MFDVSENGTLAYTLGGVSGVSRSLTWVDRQGREDPIPAPRRGYTTLRLSADGTRAALDVRDEGSDIWIWDFQHPNLLRITTDKATHTSPVWSADGRRVIFASNRTGGGIYSQLADGTGITEKIIEGSTQIVPTSLTRDGQSVLARELGSKGGLDVTLVSLDGAKPRQPLLASEKFNEANGEISPDGRWVAYESDESGQLEIYVRPFPNVDGGRWQVSSAGGTKAVWARNGRELFYATPTGIMMAVPVQTGSGFSYGTPVKLFEGPYYWNIVSGSRPFDVAPNGRRFLMIKQPPAGGSTSLVIVNNWLDRLRHQVPVRK